MTDLDITNAYCSADALLRDTENIPNSNLETREGEPSRLAGDKELFWRNGKRLKVRFLNGTPTIQAKVKHYAELWEKYANIDFHFIAEGDADIRVGFNWKKDMGTWSYVGTFATKITEATGQNSATMNFGELNDNSRESDICRNVLHEFGHAIGCFHEHQANPIKWNEPVVIADCKEWYKWDEKTTRQNIINLEQIRSVIKSDFDRKSIMGYMCPKHWTLDGTEIPKNLTLSDTDKTFIGKMYPFRTRNDGRISIDPDIRSWYPPLPLNSKLIMFEPPYLESPRVALGLTKLDEARSSNVRVRLQASSITCNDFILNMDSWQDTQLFDAASTWLEFLPSETQFQVGEMNTLEGRPWNIPPVPDAGGIRRDTRHFDFPDGLYTEPPNIVVWLSALDLSSKANWRIRCLAKEVMNTGFDLVIESWEDTAIFSASASWVAYPKKHEGVLSGKVNTKDFRDWYPAVANNKGKVNFPTEAFDKTPKVFIALSEIDMDSSKNLRVKVSADNIDSKGFIWHGDSWEDSLLYSVGADWIAFG